MHRLLNWLPALLFALAVIGIPIAAAALQERRNRDTFKWNGKDVRKL